MFTSINCTVFDIPLTWDRTRFEASRNKCRQARRLVEASVNAQFNKQLREVFFQKLDIEKDTVDSQERLINEEKKVRILDNLIDVAAESLDGYFDKRMENVRAAIQEHCNAIKQILCEENEHWKEIHTAIDQNLITSEDIHRHDNIEEEMPLANIHTINEADEDEENRSTLLNNKTVTPLLTQMIRKSRLQSNRTSMMQPIRTSTQQSNRGSMMAPTPRTSILSNRFSMMVPTCTSTQHSNHASMMDPTPRASIQHSNHVSMQETSTRVSTQQSIHTKEERFSVILPLASSRRTLPVIDTTFVVKSDQSHVTERNDSYNDDVVPMEPVPTTDVEIIPSYSQPKPPAQLYFSPTLLHDNDEPEILQSVLSIINQNQTNMEKPKIISRRFGQTFLLDNIKTEQINESVDQENLRPKISDEIPMIIPSKISIPIHYESTEESQHDDSLDHQKSMIYAKRQIRAKRTKLVRKEPEPLPEPVQRTKRTTRKQQIQVDTTQRQPRKRKQSVSDDTNNNAVALRKKKPIAPPPKPKAQTRKTRGRKPKEIPIREPSPLPVIDRSKHYSTRFSTRSHRFNNTTLSTTQIVAADEKKKPTRLRTKSMGRTRNQDVDKDKDRSTIKTARSTVNKTEPKKRAKSMMVTRNRRK